MTPKRRTKIIREGLYIAEVEVDLLYDESAWSPYLSMEDAYKLEDIRQALRAGDLETAARIGKVYTLTPLAV